MTKRLYRSKSEQMIAGVCGGLAEYINVDPTVIRVIWALLALSVAGIMLYLVCALIIPEKPDNAVIDAE